jgi:hypothetical protein
MFGDEIRVVNYERPPLALTIRAMSFAGIQRREEPVTEETFSHHVFSPANKFCHPRKILTRRETELHLNVMKNLKGVTIEKIGTVAGYFYEIAHVTLVNSWRCRWTAAPQSVPRRSCKALDRAT